MFSAGDNKLGITIYTISLYSKNEVEILLLQFDWPVFAVIVFLYIYMCFNEYAIFQQLTLYSVSERNIS